MNKSAMVGIWSKNTGAVVSNREAYLGEPEELGKILSDLFSTAREALRASILGIYCDKDPDNAMVFKNIIDFLVKSNTDYMYLYDGIGWFVATKKDRNFEELDRLLLTL